MSDHTYVPIGHTRKAHGIAGEVKFQVEDRFLEDFLKNERIFLDIKGAKVPYFIANVRGTNELIVQLEEVDNRDTALLLQGRAVYLRDTDLLADHEREFEPEAAVQLPYQYLAGYFLKDRTLGDIGTIVEVLDMPQQEMALLRYQGREVLVPLNVALIVHVDVAAKQVLMDLPDGLLD